MKTPPAKLEYQKLYRQLNREKIVAYQKEYRSLKKSSSPLYTKVYMKRWRDKQKAERLALAKLVLLYRCEQLTVENVQDILKEVSDSFK